MPGETITVRLSAAERQHLLQADYLPAELRRVLAHALLSPDAPQKSDLEISTGIADDFQEAFTQRLAKVGFDLDYQPTTEGHVLEGLIDAFSQTGDRDR